VAVDGAEEVLPLDEAVVLLEEAEEDVAEANAALSKELEQLGVSVNVGNRHR
jgi:hypothetical protein